MMLNIVIGHENGDTFFIPPNTVHDPTKHLPLHQSRSPVMAVCFAGTKEYPVIVGPNRYGKPKREKLPLKLIIIGYHDGELVSEKILHIPGNALKVPDSETLRAHSSNHHFSTMELDYDPTHKRIIACHSDGTIRILTRDRLTPKKRWSIESAVSALQMLDASRFVTGHADKTIRIWDQNGKSVGALQLEKSVIALARDPQCKSLFVGFDDGELQLCSLDEKRGSKKIDLQTKKTMHSGAPLSKLSFHPHDTFFASGHQDGSIHLWSWSENQIQCIATLQGTVPSDVFTLYHGSGGLHLLASQQNKLLKWRIDRILQKNRVCRHISFDDYEKEGGKEEESI